MKCDYQTEIKDIDDKLFDCSFKLISLLLKQYKDNTIDISTFRSHTQNKIMYILNNFDSIKDGTKKTTIESLMNECIKIINNVN